jgi:hypothetical protein
MQNIYLDNNYSIYVTLMQRSTHSVTFILFTQNSHVSPCHYVMTHLQLAFERINFQIHRVAANLLTTL